MATQDEIDQAIDRLQDAVSNIRSQLGHDAVAQVVFLLAVQQLGGREGLAQAAQECSEVPHG